MLRTIDAARVLREFFVRVTKNPIFVRRSTSDEELDLRTFLNGASSTWVLRTTAPKRKKKGWTELLYVLLEVCLIFESRLL